MLFIGVNFNKQLSRDVASCDSRYEEISVKIKYKNLFDKQAKRQIFASLAWDQQQCEKTEENSYIFLLKLSCTAKTKYLNFETNIPRKRISGPQSQFPHSYVCERLIYSHGRSPYSAGGNMWTDPGTI
jgi:hypothetical protein